MQDAGDHARRAYGELINRAALWVATGLGIGLVTPAPGTVGGAWGLLLVPVVVQQPCLPCQLTLAAILVAAAMWICERARRALDNAKDPQAIVLDEIVALPLVFVMQGELTWRLLAAGFLLFRVCDIAKPWPARRAEELPGGVGIVADDVVAAGWAWLVLRGVLWLDATAGVHWLSAVVSG